jgi:hypothetical protein
VRTDPELNLTKTPCLSPGNHQTHHQQHYQTIINPNIHSGSIPSTGRSTYATNNSFVPHNADKSVEDTRMIIEQANRMMVQKNGTEEKVILPATSYIDQPMLSAMQQMFNNTNTGMHPQNMKTIYHQPNQPQQIYFN